MEKRRQEKHYLQYGGAGHRVKEYPYLPPQSSKYPNSTPRVSPTPGDPLTGAGPSGSHHRAGQVNTTKIRKEEGNALSTDSGADTDSEKE